MTIAFSEPLEKIVGDAVAVLTRPKNGGSEALMDADCREAGRRISASDQFLKVLLAGRANRRYVRPHRIRF
jgi:hypothetical protein